MLTALCASDKRLAEISSTILGATHIPDVSALPSPPLIRSKTHALTTVTRKGCACLVRGRPRRDGGASKGSALSICVHNKQYPAPCRGTFVRRAGSGSIGRIEKPPRRLAPTLGTRWVAAVSHWRLCWCRIANSRSKSVEDDVHDTSCVDHTTAGHRQGGDRINSVIGISVASLYLPAGYTKSCVETKE